MIFEVVSMTVPALLNPKMTASWEKGLDGITRGTVVMEDYRSKLEDFIRRETVAMIEQDLTGQIATRIHPLVGKGGKGLARSAASAFPVRCAEERSRRRRSVTGAAIIRKMAADAASPSVQSPEET